MSELFLAKFHENPKNDLSLAKLFAIRNLSAGDLAIVWIHCVVDVNDY